MAKKTKIKLPKEIAGVKIPKKLRKKGGKVLEKLSSKGVRIPDKLGKKGGKVLAALDTPVGRELAAAGMMAAIAAMARRKQAAHAHATPSSTPTPEPTPAPDKPVHDGPEGRDPHAAGAQFATAAAGMAAAALDRWLKTKRASQGATPPQPPVAPEPPIAPEPPAGTTAH